MNPIECSREAEVLELAGSGQDWPAELLEHSDGCPTCRDLALLRSAFLEDRASAIDEQHIAAPALLWWRAELRLRQDRARRAVRPITLAHAFAAAGAAGMALAFARILVGPVRDLLPESLGNLTSTLLESISQVPLSLPVLLLGVGLPLVLAPVAVYLILTED